MGVDHIGVLIGEAPFPREQTIEKAHEIFAAIPAGSKGCALSLSHDVDLILRLTAALRPNILHLGAAPQHLSPAQLRAIKAEFPKISLMRSIPVVDESSIALARSYMASPTGFFSIATNPAIARSEPWACHIAGNWIDALSTACAFQRSSPGDWTRECPGGYSRRASSRRRFEDKNR